MTIHPNEVEDISVFGAVFGIVVSPRETLERLFYFRRPRYAFVLSLVLLLTFLVPIFLQRINYQDVLYHPEVAQVVLVVFVATTGMFILLQSMLMRLFRVPFDLLRTFALVSYTNVPIIFFTWLMYWMNYYCNRNVSFLVPMLIGDAAQKEEFVRLVPWIDLLFVVVTIRVYFYAVKFHGRLLSSTAAIIVFLSIIPSTLSLIAGLIIAEQISPGTLATFFEFWKSPTLVVAV